jgi:hypothetical protein
MVFLIRLVSKNSSNGIGFQIGGGIAGDFPICVVPMLYQDMEMHDVPFGVISVKFQIQQLVTILEQYQMKNYLG